MEGAPLAGLSVIDLGQGAAGPLCGRLLGDYGADVVKVEPPRGDWSRTLGSVDPATGLSSTYAALNANKRGVVLDLTREADRAAALALVAGADVLVESFRPGVMERLGLGYERLAESNPRLVYCSVTGFGGNGPRSGQPASDSMMQAFGGLMSVVGEPGGAPLRVDNIVSDMLAGTDAFAGVLLALLRRERTGAGGRVEASLLASLLSFQATGLVEALVTGRQPLAPGNRHPLIGASGVARASDGWIALGVLDHYWAAFCAAIERPELAEDARFATAASRLEHQDGLWQVLGPVLEGRDVQHWLTTLGAVGVVCSSVNDYAGVASDPQVVHLGLLGRTVRPEGELPRVAPPARIDGVTPGDRPPPALGEHDEQVLGRLLTRTSTPAAQELA